MRGLRILLYRVAGFFQRSRRDHELEEEIESNLQFQVSDNIAAGMSADEARRQALIKLGGVDQTKELYREQRGLPLLDSLSQDVRYAARVLRKSPGYTVVAVLTLALGIGANAAIFSIVYGVLLQPLPYKDPGRLVVINETKKGPEWSGFAMLGVSPPDFRAFRERNRSFEKVGAYSPGSMVVRIGRQSERVYSLQATHELFSVLGREPMLGRGFREDEEIAGNNHVVVISWRLWQKEFAGDDNALGRTLTLDRQMPSTVDTEKYVVIGIMPPSFDFPVDSETDLWMPLTVPRDPDLQGATYLPMVGRLKPGVSMTKAEADLQSIANGQKPFQWMVVLDQLGDNVVSRVRPSLWMLFGAVVFVLLIAAANMASLAVSRVSARQKEAAVRLALGAGRWRLARALLIESVLLATLAATVGLLIARFSTTAMLSIAPSTLPRLANVHLSVPVLAFTFLAAIFTGLLLGAAPAWRAGRTDLQQAMKEGSPTLTGRQPLQTAMVGFEVVLAVVLLVGAGLMIRTMAKLRSVDLGFDPHHTLTAEILLPQGSYSSSTQQLEFFDELLDRIGKLPGVLEASGGTKFPMSRGRMEFSLVHYGDDGKARQTLVGGFSSITPNYFRALGLHLMGGREFTDADNADAPPVGIVNQALVRIMWPDRNPIGQKLPNGFTKQAVTVIGVAPDMHFDGIDKGARPELFVPFAQKPWDFMRLVVRTERDPLALASSIRAQLRAIDDAQTLDKVRTFDEVLHDSTADRRFYMVLLSIFAALSLALAAIGVFGVVSYSVTQRTHEIGVRRAFGASDAQIMTMVLRKGLLPAVLGLIVGSVGALALTRVLRNLLFGISNTDPLTFAAVPAALIIAALAACWLPARRAARVDPMAALRYE